MNEGSPLLLPPENIRPTPIEGPFKTAKRLVEIFSTNHRQRDPPSPFKTRHIRLITVGLSHYCEKLRWALDLLESDPKNPYYYTEDAHPPALQAIATSAATNGNATMTPMVLYTDKEEEETSSGLGACTVERVLYDSQEILVELCPFLYPPPIQAEIREMEQYLGTHLGATIRCFMYFYLLQNQNHKLLIQMAKSNTSTIESILFEQMLGRGIAQGMKRAMKINKQSAHTSLQSMRGVFAKLSHQLTIVENGHVRKRHYLMDTTEISYGLTSADLTLCALAAPLLAPPETHEFYVHHDSLFPKEILEAKQELLQTLAGQHVLHIYRQHRFNGNGPSSESYLKVVNRDRLPAGAKMSIAAAGICTISILAKM